MIGCVLHMTDEQIMFLACKYRFGYHSIEDMQQQIWFFILSIKNCHINSLYKTVENRLRGYERSRLIHDS